MRAGVTPSSSDITLSRRRLAFIAVAAVAALIVGYLAAQVASPGHSHAASPAAPAHPSPAAATPTTTKAPSAPAGTAPAPAPSTPAGPATGTPPAAPGTSAGTAARTPAPAPATPASAAAGPGRVLPTSLPEVTARDPRTGIRVSYPRVWSRLSTKDPTVRFLLSSRDGASLEIRALDLAKPITGPRLAAIRDATGLLIVARPQVHIVAGPRLLAVAGLPGFLYIYSFYDPASHRRVGHSQIALFSGRRMYTLVFQTAVAADLTKFALLFDKITASFRAP